MATDKWRGSDCNGRTLSTSLRCIPAGEIDCHHWLDASEPADCAHWVVQIEAVREDTEEES